MIAQVAGYLLLLGVLSFMRFRPQYNRIFAYLLTFLFFGLFYNFLVALKDFDFGTFTLLWNSSPAGELKLEIVSSPTVYRMVFPFFAISAISLFNNLFYNFELYRKEFVSVIVLNLFCLIMLICSNHFIQMVTFVFFIDILSHLFIKNVNAGKHYALYNLAADMGLFGILAIINGQVESLDINHIRQYYLAERYQNFIAFLLMIVLFIKFGFCFVKYYMLELKNIRFHRLILIPYLSSSAAALILLVKLYPLLIVSPLFYNVFSAVLLLFMFYGAFGVLAGSTLKEKTIYLNMMLLALLIKLLESASFIWDIHFSWLLILSFVFNLAVYYLHYYSERTLRSSFTSRFRKIGYKVLLAILGIWVIILAAFAMQAAALLRSQNLSWEILFLILFTFVASDMFNRILRNRFTGEGASFDRAPFITLSALFVVSVYASYLQINNLPFALIACSLFLFWLIIDPVKRLNLMSFMNSKLKMVSLDYSLTNNFVRRMRIVADNILNVNDFIINMVRGTGAGVVSLFRKFDRVGVLRYIALILIALALFFILLNKGI